MVIRLRKSYLLQRNQRRHQKKMVIRLRKGFCWENG